MNWRLCSSTSECVRPAIQNSLRKADNVRLSVVVRRAAMAISGNATIGVRSVTTAHTIAAPIAEVSNRATRPHHKRPRRKLNLPRLLNLLRRETAKRFLMTPYRKLRRQQLLNLGVMLRQISSAAALSNHRLRGLSERSQGCPQSLRIVLKRSC